MTENQEKAKELYIKNRSPDEIAKELNVHPSTVYKWIKDEELGFEEAKELANFSVDAMSEMLLEAYKKTILDIKKNPEKLQDSKVADSLLKVVKVIKGLDKNVDYLGIAGDVIKVATKLIREEFEEYFEAWKQIAPRLLEKLEEEYS